MLRQGNHTPLHWANKTMSVLRANQLEACEKDLACLPCHSLFDADCTDVDAEALFEMSYYAAEDRGQKRKPGKAALHTIESLRVRVLSTFAAEAALLSMDEHDLMVRLVLFGGQVPLFDWETYPTARSLVRRLWCRVDRSPEGRLTLVMPRQLCSTMLLLLAGDQHKKVRDLVEQVHDSIDNTLYLMGMMQISAPENHLKKLLEGTHADNHPELIRRFLMAGYDYVEGPCGRLYLIHPGLAEPERMLPLMSHPDAEHAGFLSMNERELTGAADSVSDLENPMYERMLFLLMDCVRPEIAPEDAVEDLIILAKQGVPPKDMEEVLASMLICMPTAEMLNTLRDLSERTPRWIDLSSHRVQ